MVIGDWLICGAHSVPSFFLFLVFFFFGSWMEKMVVGEDEGDGWNGFCLVAKMG